MANDFPILPFYLIYFVLNQMCLICAKSEEVYALM